MADQQFLQRIRVYASQIKPGLVRVLLVLLCLLGIAAQLIEPLGDALNNAEFLGGSFAAFIALVLFDAITSGDRPREVYGVIVIDGVDGLAPHLREAFRAKHVKVDFQGFTTETLVRWTTPLMLDLAENPRGTRSVTFRIILPHLGAPMNLPSEVETGDDGVRRFRDSRMSRGRMQGYVERYRTDLERLINTVRERQPNLNLGLEVRESAIGPQSKTLVLNDEVSFFSFYNLVESEISQNGARHVILDPQAYGISEVGLRMVGWSRRSRSESTRRIADYYASHFERLWNLFGHILPPREESRSSQR